MMKHTKPLLLALTLALLLALAAIPAQAADQGVYMKPNVGYAQKGFPGVVERFEGDMRAVAEYITSPIANQQGAGISYQQRVVAPAGVSKQMTWQEWWAENMPGVDPESIQVLVMYDEQQGELSGTSRLSTGAYVLIGDNLYRCDTSEFVVIFRHEGSIYSINEVNLDMLTPIP